MRAHLKTLLSTMMILFIGIVAIAQNKDEITEPSTDFSIRQIYDPCDSDKDGSVSKSEKRNCVKVSTIFAYSRIRDCPSGHCKEILLKENLVNEKGLELTHILISKAIKKTAYTLENKKGETIGQTLKSPVKMKGIESYDVYPVRYKKGLSLNQKSNVSISPLGKKTKSKNKNFKKIPQF